ncbi:hypothetical protein QE152_g31184 [Popillia japonica]|uniref:acid phosphatase n=1 Tax=Popillia japonica TaxID=7064 RepID=A0AAW1JCC3_POPJA
MRIWHLAAHLTAQQQFGLTLPDWTKSVFPDKITNVAVSDFYLHTATKELRKIVLGNLLEKILNDIKAKIQNTSERKIHLYSAHDYNPAHILIFFNVMFNHIPNYGACIIFEVYDFGIKHGIKLKYKESKFVEFRYMTFANGSNTLDLDEFERMIRDLE